MDKSSRNFPERILILDLKVPGRGGVVRLSPLWLTPSQLGGDQ